RQPGSPPWRRLSQQGPGRGVGWRDQRFGAMPAACVRSLIRVLPEDVVILLLRHPRAVADRGGTVLEIDGPDRSIGIEAGPVEIVERRDQAIARVDGVD